jgi:ABC-type multidrug transport system ATPase subunit
MQELKGETTVFYSTHILDDVQRVSDHIAILDHGCLVKAAPTQALLGSFKVACLDGRPCDRTEARLRPPGVLTIDPSI